jgi:HK97 family phage prohead protease
MTTIFRDFQVKAQSVDEEARTVEGYASTWDMDQVDDIIHFGAFQKSINERFSAGKVKVLWQHADPIGIPLEMTEDDKGLWVKAKISKTALGDEALQLAKDRVVDRFSIGFSIPKGKAEIDENGIRHIYEAKLMEFSLVTFAANEAAVLTAVKHLRQSLEEKGLDPVTAEVKDPKEKDAGEFDELKSMLEEFSTFAKHRLY